MAGTKMKRRTTPDAAAPIRFERRKVSDMVRAGYNPRADLKPGDPAYERIKASLAEFGLVDPLIFNRRTGRLVGGHQRLKVLVDEFGAEEVDVAVVDLDPGREKDLNVRLNAVHGRWEDGLLRDVLAELETLPGFDAEAACGLDAAALEQAAAASEEDARAAEAAPQDKRAEQPKMERSYKVVVTCVSKRQQDKVMRWLDDQNIAAHTLTRE